MKDLKHLKTLHQKVNKRRPWANEGVLSGTARLAKDGMYASAQIAIPRIGAQNMRLKKKQLNIMTATGAALFNLFVSKTKELVDGFDATRTSAYDLGAFALHAASGFSDKKYDHERQYNVDEYFALREKMRENGTLPSKWGNTFESIQEDFSAVLEMLNIPQVRPLPKKGKTVGRRGHFSEFYSEDTRQHAVNIFGPFMEHWNYVLPSDWAHLSISDRSRAEFAVLSFFRHNYWKYLRPYI